jgi:surface antigen
VGWRTHISREVSSSLPPIGIGLSSTTTASKLKLPKAGSLPQPKNLAAGATLTPVGRAVRATTHVAGKLYAVPRLVAHAGIITLVGAVVLTGSTGHSASLNPLADQTGYGSVLDPAAAANVAAKVADQTNLLVTHQVDTTAKSLNAEVSLPTSDDTTLAQPEVVNTAGATTRGTIKYTVQPGDTLSSIAAQFNITSDTVLWANNLGASDSLAPGQSLVILPISGVQYTVQPGDTPASIAAHFQSNADQIIAFNNAEAAGLQPGQVVIVPDGVMPGAASASPAAATPAGASAASVPTTPLHVQVGGPNDYAFGYCTYYVATQRSVPGWWGNAIDWYANAQISGYSVGAVPRVGAIAWSGAGYYGHVAYVIGVSGDMVTVHEMNWDGHWDQVTTRTTSASSFRYIY